MKLKSRSEALAEDFLEHEARAVCSSQDPKAQATMYQRLKVASGKSVSKIAKRFDDAVQAGKITKHSTVDEAFEHMTSSMGVIAVWFMTALLKALAYRFISWALNRMNE